jgi:Fic family protein
VDLGTLAELHARYELIHPFQDGNGRTGRIILYKECIEHDIMPFIIHNENRTEYVISLKEAQTRGTCSKLAKYFEREQKDYAAKCELYDIYSRYDFFLKSTNDQNEGKVIKFSSHRSR